MIENIEKKAPQYPENEILNEKERLVRSWSTVEMVDSQGDIVPISDIKRTLNIWMDRGAPINDLHSNRQVGKGLNWQIAEHPESKTDGVVIDYRIYDNYSRDNEVWDEIKSGVRRGLSIGARMTGKTRIKTDENTGEEGRELSGLELYEISSVDNPANPLAENIAVNYLAKSGNELKDEHSDKIEIIDEVIGILEKRFETLDAQKSKSLNKKISKINNMIKTGGEITMEKSNELVGKQGEIVAPTAPAAPVAPAPETNGLSEINAKLDQLIALLTDTMKAKKEEDMPPEKEPVEEEKKVEEEKPEDKPMVEPEKKPEEKKKEAETITLPKGDLPGETDETAKPENDKVQVVEKSELKKAITEILTENIDEVLKSKGYSVTKSERAPADTPAEIEKAREGVIVKDDTLEMMDKVMKGQMTLAQMNMVNKNQIQSAYDDGLTKIRNDLRNGGN